MWRTTQLLLRGTLPASTRGIVPAPPVREGGSLAWVTDTPRPASLRTPEGSHLAAGAATPQGRPGPGGSVRRGQVRVDVGGRDGVSRAARRTRGCPPAGPDRHDLRRTLGRGPLRPGAAHRRTPPSPRDWPPGEDPRYRLRPAGGRWNAHHDGRDWSDAEGRMG